MKYKPHDYQTYATEYIISHPVAALFLDCGLGKTVCTLTALWSLALDSFEVGRILVIAPLRVARDTWPAEIEKWDHLQGLTYSVVVGSEKERRAVLMRKANIYIVNRENVSWLIHSGYFRFDMVVIDELSSFKGWQTKRYKDLRKVRSSVKRIVGLTGTPALNGLMDLFAEIGILDMGQRLGRYITHYRDTYFVPDKRNQQIVFSYKPKPGAEEAIYQKILDICVSMKAEDHLKMPDLISTEVPVQMSAEERKLYDQLKKDMFLSLKDGEIDPASAVGLSNKLHQMADGSVYGDDGKVLHIHDRKYEALEDLIEAANGKPVLIAYWFKFERDELERRFHAEPIDTSEDIRRWNEGQIPVALIHPASAGHGLNLQSGGSHLIWFSTIWSLELYQQCNRRLYRQGQKSTVVIQHIITKGTIDEDVMKALEKKDVTQEALMASVRRRIETNDDDSMGGAHEPIQV